MNDFTGQFISSTYQRVLQISESRIDILDGTGSRIDILNVTASYALNGGNGGTINTSSFIINAQTASMTVLSASYAVSSSRAVTASYVLNAVSSSLASTASFITGSRVFGPYGSNSIISASWANISVTSSYSLNTNTSSLVTNSQTSSFIKNNQTSSMSVHDAQSSMTSSYNPNALVSAAVSYNIITFVRGNNTTFDITIDTGSSGGSSIYLHGFAGTGTPSSVYWASSNPSLINIFQNPL